jgi:hypothetical protein
MTPANSSTVTVIQALGVSPMIVAELKTILSERGIRKNAVSFSCGILTAAEQYCISREGSFWEVYYYERGNKNNLQVFLDESGACLYLLSILEKDKTV